MGKATYSNKRQATRNKIDTVFIENIRSTGGTDLTVKQICEKAGINRSTFYTYYKDTIDVREQIEGRLIGQFEKRIAPKLDQLLVNPNMILLEIMEYNREFKYLPLLLISSGSSSFVYRLSRSAVDMVTSGHMLTDDVREKITMLLAYHFAGISMTLRQIRDYSNPSDEDYENTVQKTIELLLPVVKNGLLPTIKELYKSL